MKIAIFCGSSSGENPTFVKATKALGCFLASNGVDLVYGGGKVGLMGVIADSFLENNRKVYGVMPEHLKQKEIANQNLTELKIVSDMHERKATMAQMADAFVALPGAAGTLEEIFEAWTWVQLGYHSKPCAFYNINGFYNPLIEMISHMSESDFLKEKYAEMLIHTDKPSSLLSSIKSYNAPKQKWT